MEVEPQVIVNHCSQGTFDRFAPDEAASINMPMIGKRQVCCTIS